MFEKLYSVQDVAVLFNLSTDLVRRLFINEPGVIIICTRRRGFRIYRTIPVKPGIKLRRSLTENVGLRALEIVPTHCQASTSSARGCSSTIWSSCEEEPNAIGINNLTKNIVCRQ